MPRPWRTIDDEVTDEGTMTLLQRGEDDFVIRMNHYVLMTSDYSVSEVELGRRAAEAVAGRRAPRVLVAGLGMGFTLRAALDALPVDARVVVAELNPVVADWCRGPLARLSGRALDDPRVELRVDDVARVIAGAARGGARYDAIVLDLYQGTHDANDDPRHPFYGRAALDTTRRALTAGGVLAVWTEHRDPRFEERLRRVGFVGVERHEPDSGGMRHAVNLARRGEEPTGAHRERDRSPGSRTRRRPR
jgi:spermidine synthase